ncbi:MAG: ABC transporter permease [Chloroflexota bacterium]
MTANPVLLHELRTRMRGSTAYSLLTTIILVFGAFTLATYWVITSQIRPISAQVTVFSNTNERAPRLDHLLIAQRGAVFFLVMSLWAIVMAALIIPASTSGTISREREQHTLAILVGTPLRPASIVAGKLLGAVVYILLLVAAAIPVFSVVIMFGGIALDQAINVVIVLAATTFAFGALGVFISAATRNSLLASLLTYSIVLAVTLGSYALYLISSPLSKAAHLRYILYFSPLGAIVSALTQTNSQLSALVAPFFRDPGTRVAGEWWSVGHYPLWYVTTVGYLLAGVVLMWGATRLIDPLRPWVTRRRSGQRSTAAG